MKMIEAIRRKKNALGIVRIGSSGTMGLRNNCLNGLHVRSKLPFLDPGMIYAIIMVGLVLNLSTASNNLLVQDVNCYVRYDSTIDTSDFIIRAS